MHVWESSAGGSFSVRFATDAEPLGRGTRIVLHMKEDTAESLEEKRLTDLAKKHRRRKGNELLS